MQWYQTFFLEKCKTKYRCANAFIYIYIYIYNIYVYISYIYIYIYIYIYQNWNMQGEHQRMITIQRDISKKYSYQSWLLSSSKYL